MRSTALEEAAPRSFFYKWELGACLCSRGTWACCRSSSPAHSHLAYTQSPAVRPVLEPSNLGSCETVGPLALTFGALLGASVPVHGVFTKASGNRWPMAALSWWSRRERLRGPGDLGPNR